MIRCTLPLLLTAAASLFSTAGDAAAQTIVKTTTSFTTWTGCRYWQYCYTVTAGPNGIVGSFEIDFPRGNGIGDIDSVSKPFGWTHALVPAAGGAPSHVRFTGVFGTRIAPGATAGPFCITTKCNPLVVYGPQNWRAFAPGGGGGLPAGTGLCSLTPHAPSNFLFGDIDASPGSAARLFVVDEEAPRDLAQLFVGLPMTQPLLIPGFQGELWIDPVALFPLGAPIPLDPGGYGQRQLPIPPNPELIGLSLMLQSATIANGIEFSNGWNFDIR